MPSRLWSHVVIEPFAWSASLLLPGEVNSFAVVSAVGKFYGSGGAGSTYNPPPLSSGLGTGHAGVINVHIAVQIQLCKSFQLIVEPGIQLH